MSSLAAHSVRPGSFHRRFLAHVLDGPGLRRQRARLAALDDHLLKDIGITRAEALAEAERPVWDAAARWVR